MHELETTITRALKLNALPSFDGDLDYQAPPVDVHSLAAVLILINNFDDPSIILTKRQDHMRTHSGQVAFPGGRKEDSDASLWETALREAHEEIGIPLAHPLNAIGALSTHKTITGFEVTPFVALNAAPFEMRPAPREVAEIFEYPLRELQLDKFRVEGHDYNGKRRHYYVLEHEEHYIWGATARMLYQLASRIENAQ